jgi:2-dehydropantoate 2-reductase
VSARVLVVGTGGVGGYFGAALAAGGRDVVFVARGAGLSALRSSGLRVSGMRSFVLPSVSATDAPSGEFDVVLLCVKTYDLSSAAALVRSCGGVVVTLQNGVEAASRVATVVGDRVLAGTTNVVADLVTPGEVSVVSSYARITFGEPSRGMSLRASRVRDVLFCEGVDAVLVEDVGVALWEKMANICAMAGLTTRYGAPIGVVREVYREEFVAIVAECSSVARAHGVPLPEDFVEARMRWADQVPAEATSSMLRDLVRGKRLEVDDLNGAVVRLGREVGVGVPANEEVYEAVRAAAESRVVW